MRKRLKNSVGIWGFGPNATRFLPEGYHPETEEEDMVERTKRVAESVGEYIDGFEYHFPGEIREESADAIVKALGGKDVYCVPLGFHSMPEFGRGSFVSPEPRVRGKALELAKRALDLARELGAHLIIWPGAEGYNYPFQVDFLQQWDLFLDGIAEVTAHAAEQGVTIFLEHKNSEPAMKILMRNIGMTLFTIQKVREKGVDTRGLKINMDWQHLIMNGEHLAEYAALLMNEGVLGHMHSNSGWGTFDDDNMTGGLNFMEALALAKEMQLQGYGSKGERIGFDLFPYTEDPVQAAVQSVKQWEFIYDLAAEIPSEEYQQARREKDAVACYRIVYRALGMDEKKIAGYFKKNE